MLLEEEHDVKVTKTLQEKNESFQRVELLLSTHMDNNTQVDQLNKENDDDKLISKELEQQLLQKMMLCMS